MEQLSLIPTIEQHEITTLAIEAAIKKLIQTKCKYYVISPNGTRYDGGLVLVPEKVVKIRKHAPSKHPHGAIKKYYDLFMNYDMKSGDVCVIPVGGETVGGPITADDIRGALTSHLSNIWGNKSYTSLIHKNNVQIMRN
jgi:hypothetical protein